MGGSSKSSSSSSQSTTNATHNESMNNALSGDVEEGAVALSGQTNNVTQNITDGGAFETVEYTTEAAIDLVREAMNGLGGIVTELSENQVEVMGAANTLAGAAVANMASASGAEPVVVKPPMTEKTKIALAVAGVFAAGAAAYAYRGKK